MKNRNIFLEYVFFIVIIWVIEFIFTTFQTGSATWVFGEKLSGVFFLMTFVIGTIAYVFYLLFRKVIRK